MMFPKDIPVLKADGNILWFKNFEIEIFDCFEMLEITGDQGQIVFNGSSRHNGVSGLQMGG